MAVQQLQLFHIRILVGLTQTFPTFPCVVTKWVAVFWFAYEKYLKGKTLFIGVAFFATISGDTLCFVSTIYWPLHVIIFFTPKSTAWMAFSFGREYLVCPQYHDQQTLTFIHYFNEMLWIHYI